MPQFFKETEEKKPFAYPIITEVRKESNNYAVWIIRAIALLIIIGAAIFILK